MLPSQCSTKRLKRKVQSLWPLTAQTFVLDTAATFEFRFCPWTDPWQQYLTANSDRLSHFGHRMSLFLQTLVFRGICCVSRGIAKNVGVAMTLWPTGPTRGEEANEIEICNFNTL